MGLDGSPVWDSIREVERDQKTDYKKEEFLQQSTLDHSNQASLGTQHQNDSSYSIQSTTKMKFQILGAIASLAIASSAAPASHSSSSLELKAVQLQNLVDALKSHGSNINQDVAQLITCNVSYSLALSKLPLINFSASFDKLIVIQAPPAPHTLLSWLPWTSPTVPTLLRCASSGRSILDESAKSRMRTADWQWQSCFPCKSRLCSIFKAAGLLNENGYSNHFSCDDLCRYKAS